MKKIAIVGTAPSSRELAPYDDETWEIWSLGSNTGIIKRFNRWFELHTERVLREAGSWEGLLPSFKKFGPTLWLGHENPELPDAQIFPIDEIKRKFGTYFTSSIAYMIALAIHDGANEIGIWGVDMLGEEEYARQKACCEYFLGMAQGRGIEIVIADESPLLRHERLYAFERCELSAEIIHMRKELMEEMNKYTNGEQAARDQKNFFKGQMAMLTNIHMRFG